MLEFERRYGKTGTTPRGNEPGEGGGYRGGGASKWVAIALAVVAAALLAVLLIMMSNKNRLVKDLNSEKDDLTGELIALQNDYAELSTTNAAINDSLAVEKEKVVQLIERLQKTDATNRAKIKQYEKEVGTLRTIMRGYIAQIDSLNTLNTALRKEASPARMPKRAVSSMLSSRPPRRNMPKRPPSGPSSKGAESPSWPRTPPRRAPTGAAA